MRRLPARRPRRAAATADAPISPAHGGTLRLCGSDARPCHAAEVVAKTKLHTLDTIAAMVSGSRLKAGKLAARYVDSLGGKPHATVIGTGILTSTVNAALANGMSAHGDETDDSHLRGRFHPGCGTCRRRSQPRNLQTAVVMTAARCRTGLRHRCTAHVRARLRQALYRAP